VLNLAKKKEIVQAAGKRKRAIARAFAKKGSGNIFINKKPLEILEPETIRLMIKEPLIIAGDIVKKLDINVNVKGGGIFGQASAIRQAIAKVLVNYDKNLKEKFLNYDKSLLIADVRRTEPHKPSRSKAGPRRHKQRSKR
jgi:small subunit ribosomal protein S9